MRYPSFIRYPRFSRRTKASFAIIAIVVAVMILLRDCIERKTTEVRLEIASRRARAVLNDPGVLRARVSAAGWMFEVRTSKRFGIADALVDLARSSSGDERARAEGIAHLLARECTAAARALAGIRIPGARDWNDLGAAEICVARRLGRPEAWLAALSKIDQALALDPVNPEAHFNRAIIAEALGITPLTRSFWQRYLRLDNNSQWAEEAKQRLSAIPLSHAESWKTATAQLQQLSPAELIKLTERHPQAARRHADLYLTLWAANTRTNSAAARQWLAVTRTIGTTLEHRGEPITADAIHVIDRAAADRDRLRELIEGEIAYRDGRVALRDIGPTVAETSLRTAARHFDRAGSPRALVAEFWVACALTEQNRLVEAMQILDSLRSRSAALQRYPSLSGHVHYQIAVIEAGSGNWTASMVAAETSRTAFAKLGELGHLANATGVLSEDYDFLGQPQRSWDLGAIALRESAADGAYDRTRAILAGLCRTELRGGRWEHARSLARLEAAIAPFAVDPRMDPDMFIRRATAEWHLEDDAAAVQFVSLARTTADRIPDQAVRTKLLADVAAIEGTFSRRRDPARAVELLSRAITFQHEAARPFIVPELYLQRGRAYLTLGDLDAAEADFEAGLSELERQRNAVSEAELRPGIFDDAAQLFDETITLQLRRGADAERVLHTVERGRARAMLEQIDARDDSSAAPELPRIREVQQALPAGAALVEYVSLPDRLVVFVIARDRLHMRTLPISRAVLSGTAAAFVRNRGADGAALHDLLVAPIRDNLRGVTAITIVADDFLQRVPFRALSDRTTKRYLIEDYAIADSPSAAVFLAGVKRSRRLPMRQQGTALVFANPAVPREEFGDLASLAGAEYEARRVARHYADVELFTRAEATAERFFELAPRHDFVHFAGHGVINYREPYASALVCARTEKTPGGVTARDIARMKFESTRVVILAACSTMTGRNAAVEGVPSLARAFLIAGVPSVIGTLWDIEDGEAAAITNPLHEQLARGVPPGEALRNAQLKAIERGLPPSQWSAFALMGNVP